MSDDDPIAETLPLDAWHRARGARMVPFAGYAMPIQYEGIIAEHNWTREHAGLFDVSHMGQLTLAGDGLDEALEALLPADVKSLALGRTRYSLLLNDQGGIIDDLMFSRWPTKIYMVVNGAVKAGDIAHMRAKLPPAITINHMTERALLALQGPEAFDALARLATGQWDLGLLSFMMGGPFQIGGVDAWISRSGYTGEDGFEISVDATAVEQVADLLCQQPEVKPIGLGARDSLRLEAGLPLYGHDLDTKTDPISADLGFAISKRRRAEG
ncbi:MAG TPA: glycine cleavage system aminomethyltransferase GcvT, partial [Sphingomonas sp.]|nr:glycine cleavage system aminomethyltransferase GcvT [Sphingomonas sp.]